MIEQLQESLKNIVSDDTNRLYIKTKKYPDGELFLYKEVDNFIKTLLITHTISILEAEVERLKELELTYEPDLSYIDPDFRITQRVYEQALQDQITYLTNQINKIREM